MKRLVALCVCLLLFTLTASAETFGDVEWLKTENGKKEGTHGHLVFDSEKKSIAFADTKNNTQVTIPYDAVKGLLYERTARPRYVSGLLIAWPLLFTKGKKHYITIQYSDSEGKGQFALFHLDKGNYREVVATAEATTGRKAERSEER